MRAPFLARRRGPRLTVCVPAYRAGAFIARTVASVQAQEFGDWRLVIANDGGHDRAAFAPFAGDARIEVRHEPERRGWVGNTNRLIRAVRTELFAVLPHDDVVAPEYYARMIALLDAAPGAICAHGAIRNVTDAKVGIARSEPVRGGLSERIAKVLTMSYAGFSYRAVNRTPRARGRLTLPGNRHGGVYADSNWMMRQAVLGEMLYCDAALYDKHYHGANEHMAWERRPPAEIAAAWFTHCRQLAMFALAASETAEQRAEILRLAQARLFPQAPHPCPAYIQRAVAETWTDARRDAVRTALAAAAERGARRLGRRRCWPWQRG